MKRILILCMILFAGAVSAQDGGQALSLKQAQDFAMQNNYELRNTKADLLIAEKKVKETTAIGLPQVNAEASFQQMLDIPTQVIPAQAFNPQAPEGEFVAVQFGTEFNTAATITATQLIFDGSYIVGLQASKVYSNISRQAVDKKEIDVREAVTQAYHTCLVAEENVEVMKSSLDNMQKLLDETQKIFESGLIEEQDVEQLQLSVASIENAYNQAVRQQELSYILLKIQMGMDIKSAITLTDDLETIISSMNMETVVNKEFNPNNNIDYQMMETQVELQALNVKNQKMSSAPSLGAFFSHSQNALRNEFDVFDDLPWFPTTVWGLNLSVPIWGSGQRYHRIGQAKLELEKAETTRDMVGQTLEMQVMNARSEFLTAYSVFVNERNNLALAEKIQMRTLTKYKEGVASSMELTQAQNQYLSTQGNYIVSMLNLLNAKSALDQLLNP